MDIALNEAIANAIKSAVSGSCTHVYFDHVPDKKLFQHYCITYEVQNTSVSNAFDCREFAQEFTVDIKSNNPNPKILGQNSAKLNDAIYNLQGTAFQVAERIDTELFYDNDLGTYTEFVRFIVK